MFVFESCVFLLFLGACCLWSLLRDELRQRHQRRQAQQISGVVQELVGVPIQSVEMRFGPAQEVVEGRFGRNLHVWKAPPATGLPPFSRVVVVTLTTDAEDRVTNAVWRRQ